MLDPCPKREVKNFKVIDNTFLGFPLTYFLFREKTNEYRIIAI
jgi:hypothetical protein